VLVRAKGVERYLRYFVALGRVPDGHGSVGDDSREPAAEPAAGPILIMAGYCVVHLLEHTINAHFHFGEETHGASCFPAHGQLGDAGLSLHALFDGVAIGSDSWCRTGWLADFSGHLPAQGAEGFTMASVMLASGRSRSAALYSAVALAAATLAGCW